MHTDSDSTQSVSHRLILRRELGNMPILELNSSVAMPLDDVDPPLTPCILASAPSYLGPCLERGMLILDANDGTLEGNGCGRAEYCDECIVPFLEPFAAIGV
jgi:hypothetical protein